MSMMDAMNNPAPAQPQSGQPQPQQGAPGAGPGTPPQQGGMRMGQDDPQAMAEQFHKIMALVSQEIWEGQGSNMVAERLHQPGAQPAEVVGTFTGMYLQMVTQASKSKGGMIQPILIVAAAGQIASQLTDLALMFKMVEPKDADDTAEAGALIGIEALLQNAGNQMQPDEKQEYQDIATAIIKASPKAKQIAADQSDEAVAEVAKMATDPNHPEPDADNQGGPSDNDADNQPPQAGGMNAAMMGGA